MHTFKDAKDRTWELAITVASIERVRKHADVDLAGLFEDELKPFEKLLADPVGLIHVLFVLCERQATDKKVESEEFGEAFYGDALEAAALALKDELIFFTPNRRIRDQMRRVFEAAFQAAARIQDRGDEEIAKLDPDALASAYIASRTKSAESSASIPDPSL